MNSCILLLFFGLQPRSLMIYFSAQIMPDLSRRNHFRLAPFLLTCPCYYFSFKHIITFWHNKMFQGHLILCPSEPWNWLFSQSAMVPFSGEWHLETNVWEMGCSVLPRKMHLLNFWQQDTFYRLWCVLIHWSGIWLFFLLATFLFNLKLSSAVSPLPGLISHPSCPFLCPVHTPFCPVSIFHWTRAREPIFYQLCLEILYQGNLLQGKVDFSWILPYSDLGLYKPCLFEIGWKIGNSSGAEGKSKRVFSVSTK